MTIKQIGNYGIALFIIVVVTFVLSKITGLPFTIQQIFNVIAGLALLRTMEK